MELEEKKKHIMHSGVVGDMMKENHKHVQKIIDELWEAVKPIRDRMQRAEKGDECLIVNFYVRKGNDKITMAVRSNNLETSHTISDGLVALEGHKSSFYKPPQ